MLATRGKTAVLLGYGQSKRPEFPEPGNDVLGDIAVAPVNLFGHGRDLVLGEAPERCRHHVEVSVEMPGSRVDGQVGEPGRIPVGLDECPGAGQRVAANPPGRFASK